jgi:hypothetical protein
MKYRQRIYYSDSQKTEMWERWLYQVNFSTH